MHPDKECKCGHRATALRGSFLFLCENKEKRLERLYPKIQSDSIACHLFGKEENSVAKNFDVTGSDLFHLYRPRCSGAYYSHLQDASAKL